MKSLIVLSLLMTATVVSAKTVPTVKGKLVTDDASISLTGYKIEVLHTCRESKNGGTISHEVSREIVSAPVSDKDGTFVVKKHNVKCPELSNYRKFYVSVVHASGHSLSTGIGGDINVLNNVYRRDFNKRNLTIELMRNDDGELRAYTHQNF